MTYAVGVPDWKSEKSGSTPEAGTNNRWNKVGAHGCGILVVLNHPPIVFIRSYSNWLDSHSDKVEVPGSSPGLRTTFFGAIE